MFKILLALAVLFPLALVRASDPVPDTFVGSFAEPRDGGNLDTARSTFDGETITIVPRAHANEALGGATRWRNVLFAVRGVMGKRPAFRLPLTSPGSGKVVLSGDAVSFQNIKLVWSYEPNAIRWTAFDSHVRTGTSASTWTVEARNTEAFTADVVYVSINEHFPVADYYDWLETDVFTHAWVRPTPSEATPGTFVIGYQSGAVASAACSRAIPDMPLFGFIIRDPAATPTKLVMLVSGQHPYEGQNKVALQAAVDWILNSTSAEARAYRATYVTVVYPFVNPTGELAGLWRGTAYQPTKDTNRNWQTTETVPSRNRGIDTVIVHKNAMQIDIAALGLGEPYAIFDYHQNFGDHPGTLDYVLHSTLSLATTAPVARRVAASDYAPYFARLNAQTAIADMPSDLITQETLRGYMVARGSNLPLTFERSVYNTIASEWRFGVATVQALVDPATVPVPDPVVAPLPATEPPPAPPALLVADDFTGSGSLNRRVPDGGAPTGSAWTVETGILFLNLPGAVATNNSARATIDATSADVEATASTTLFGANATGLVLRATDTSNYLRFVITATSWSLQKTAGAVTSTLATGKGGFSLGASHVLTASLQGEAITLAIDGTVVGTANIAFNATATRHGLLASGSGDRNWDRFVLRRL